MKYIVSSEATEHSNSPSCIVYEYGNNGVSDIAKAVINGRYPQSKFALNELSDMAIFVISGEGKIVTKQSETTLQKEDAVFIDKNEPYYYEGVNLRIIISSTPVWLPSQYKEVG